MEKKFILQSFGSIDHNESEYKDFSTALKAFNEETKQIFKKFGFKSEDAQEWCDSFEYEKDGGYLEIGAFNKYQVLQIINKPETQLEQAKKMISDAQMGLIQYSFELLDTGCCSSSLDDLDAYLTSLLK